MDKMQAVSKVNELVAKIAQAKRYDHAVNEGGEGYETSEALGEQFFSLMQSLPAMGLCYVNGKMHDAETAAEVRAAWNAAIMANASKGALAALAAARKATGYEMSQVAQLKAICTK